jgi:Cof subfamily protein (haloacid dehalogenase superfamily)
VTVRLVGIDVDGTLLGRSGIVDARIWQAAARASAAGIRLVLCSGRPAFGVTLQYARQLDAEGWHIFQNGASIVRAGNGESRSSPLPAHCITQLIAAARRTPRILELYADSRYVVEQDAPWSRSHAALLGVPFLARPLASLELPVVRAQWLLTAAQADELLQQTDPSFEMARSSSPLMPDTTFVGVTRRGVCKGEALRTVAAELGVTLADVMYVGDAGNDLSALRIVGHPVAMGNADAEVRGAAKHVVRSVEEAGLAQALELAL